MSEDRIRRVRRVPKPEPKSGIGGGTKSALGWLGAIALFGGGVWACDEVTKEEPERYCVDRTTNQRVSDFRCKDGTVMPGHFYSWYWVPAGTTRPSIGSTPHSGSFTKSSVERGGFGSSGGGTGG